MKSKRLILAALLSVLVLGPSFLLLAGEPAITTHVTWTGFLVIGEREKGDPIAGRGAFPKADETVEIGLRSDGVVVWRKAQPN